MRADWIVVHASDDEGKGLPGRPTKRLRLLFAARVKIDVGMVAGNCTHGALLVPVAMLAPMAETAAQEARKPPPRELAQLPPK
jgi:hypothetical protein